jgi:hypothetical protein
MTAMTPLAKIWWLGNAIFTQDAVGGLREVCMCPTAEDRDWIVWSLAKLHGVPFDELRVAVPQAEPGPGSRHAAETLPVSRDAAGVWRAEGPASAFGDESP